MKIFLFWLIIVSISFAQSESKEREKFDPERDPAKDLIEVIAKAKKENKRILLDVGGEWCIWCHRIDEFILNEPEISEYLNKHYITLKVNYSKENKNEQFLSKYPAIEGYPHFFVLDKKGKLIHSQNTGELEMDKSYDKEKFMTFLKKWSGKKKSN